MDLNFKGAYSAGTNYGTGDVVKFELTWYVCINDTPAAGIPCTDTLYWERAGKELEVAAELVNDAVSAINAKIEALTEAELPEEDGAYALTATVSSGEVTYSWESGETAASEPAAEATET